MVDLVEEIAHFEQFYKREKSMLHIQIQLMASWQFNWESWAVSVWVKDPLNTQTEMGNHLMQAFWGADAVVLFPAPCLSDSLLLAHLKDVMKVSVNF